MALEGQDFLDSHPDRAEVAIAHIVKDKSTAFYIVKTGTPDGREWAVSKRFSAVRPSPNTARPSAMPLHRFVPGDFADEKPARLAVCGAAEGADQPEDGRQGAGGGGGRLSAEEDVRR